MDTLGFVGLWIAVHLAQPDSPMMGVIAWGINLSLWSAALRSLLIAAGRVFGLYHPVTPRSTEAGRACRGVLWSRCGGAPRTGTSRCS